MNLEGILSISGKPGLYKLVAQSRGGVIVQAIDSDKRFPVSQNNNVSALQDIAIYTYDEDIPLGDVFTSIAQKENYGPAIDHKESPEALRNYMEEVMPDYDKDRVYNSDLKKLFQWYNLLHEYGLITPDEKEVENKNEAQATTDNTDTPDTNEEE